MDSWCVGPSDKAWDFDENECMDNVVFLDGPQNSVRWNTVITDVQNITLKNAPGTSEFRNDELGDVWEPTRKRDDTSDDPNGPPIRKLFVGNLPYRVTDSKLRTFFAKFGKVINAHVKREPTKRRNSYYGFVTFHKPEEARSALTAPLRELSLFGYQLTVNKADNVHQPVELPDGTIEWLPGKRFHKITGEPILDKSKKPRSEEEPLPDLDIVEPMEADDQYKEEDASPFSSLNDDCLLHIFSFLSLTDRVRVERVCKQWQFVARSMWRRMHSLDMRLLALPPHHLHSMGVLKSILKRCGDSLTALSLAIYSHSRHRRSKFLPIVGTLCPNLLELDAAGVKLNKFGLQRLGNGCAKLRKINFNYCSGVDERNLESLLRILPDLESVSLAGWVDLSGHALSKLPPDTMRELNLNECNNLRPCELLMAVKRLPLLATLSVTSCISLSNQHVKVLCESAPQLRSLTMAQYFPRLKYASLESIGVLKGLKALNLELNDLLTDTGLEAIVNGCKELEYLNISGCRTYAPEHVVTSNGIKSLGRLPYLQELHMSYLPSIDDEALFVLAQNGFLRKLVCRGCPSFRGDGFIRVISLCPDLELLDVSGCDHVKISVVKTAITFVKVRNVNTPLRLVCGGTSVVYEQVEVLRNDFPPQLSVELVDLCVHHLRPDFVDGVYFNDILEYSDGEADDLEAYNNLCEEIDVYGDLLMNYYGGRDPESFEEEDELEFMI